MSFFLSCPFFIRPIIGIIVLMGLCLFFGKKVSVISWKKIFFLLLSQIFILILCLKTSMTKILAHVMEKGIMVLTQGIKQGTSFVFGPLGSGEYPFVLKENAMPPLSFMFQILPSIMIMGALSMILFHWGFLPWIVRHISRIFGPLWRIGGALSTAMAAKIFWGMTDTPLFVKPYLKNFSPNEIFSLMVVGMSTASVSIFALYYTLLSPHCPQVTSLILTMTLGNIPCALWVSEILVPGRLSSVKPGSITTKKHWLSFKKSFPHSHEPQCCQGNLSSSPFSFKNTLDAITQGALQGWTLMGIIGSITIVFIALVYLGDSLTESIFELFSIKMTLKKLLGYFFVPLTWFMALDNNDILKGAELLAQKTLLNEVVALLQIGKGDFTPRSLQLLIFPLCNFGALCGIALQSATLANLAPEKGEVANSLGLLALYASIVVGMMSSFFAFFIL